MERERREQLERMKQSQQPTPKTSLSESMNRLSLNSDQIFQAMSDNTFVHTERSVQPDKSSPQHLKPSNDLTTITSTEADKENPVYDHLTTSTTLSSINVINTSSAFSSQSNTSSLKNSNYEQFTKTIPKTPQSQKTKQLFKRKMISPMQNSSLVKEETDEDLTTVSKRLTFENTTVLHTSVPTRLINESNVKLSTPEKTLTKRITLHKTSNVRKAPDVPFSLKFVF